MHAENNFVLPYILLYFVLIKPSCVFPENGCKDTPFFPYNRFSSRGGVPVNAHQAAADPYWNAPKPVVGCTGMRTGGVPDTCSRRMPAECSVSPSDGKYLCKILQNRVILYSSGLLQCYLKAFKLHNNNNIQRYLQKINLSDPENVWKKGFFSSFAGRFLRILRLLRKKN